MKEAIQKANNSIDISVYEVSSIMQQHGEYDQEAEHESQQLITNEHLQELKKVLKHKIKEWTKKYSFKDNMISLSLLYFWKRIDEEAMKKYLSDTLEEEEELLHFLKIFNTVSYSQSLGDYTTREHKKFNYKNIEDFIDFDFIEKKIRKLDISDFSEEIQYSVKMFLDYFDENISLEEDFEG